MTDQAILETMLAVFLVAASGSVRAVSPSADELAEARRWITDHVDRLLTQQGIDLYRLVAQWRGLAGYYFGDYYPLTAYNPGDDVWLAWQFHRDDLGEGMLQVFRRRNCIYEAARLRLRGLDRDGRYTLTDLDKPPATQTTGRELTEVGLRVCVKKQPGAAVITYKRVK